MVDILKRLRQVSTAPFESSDYNEWLKQTDIMQFMNDSVNDDEIIAYASLSVRARVTRLFIHGVLVPKAVVTPPDIDDLLSWNCNPYASWSLRTECIDPPLAHSGSKSLERGEQIVFLRSFEGVQERQNYVEILQKFVHVSGIHHMPERDAWCRLDQHGDFEDVIRVITVSSNDIDLDGTIVLVSRDMLGKYAALTDSVLVRMFDFTRSRPQQYNGWSDSHTREQKALGRSIYYRIHIEEDYASFSRGVQIAPIATVQQADEPKEYATYIAWDWKNKRIDEISCSPDALSNYFTESNLPYETTPAFFRPEVLSKYKADREKYRFEERSISCRGSWHLQSYDINEAGQVHTYLVYLSHLPYEEQLHWKQFSEKPKKPISDRSVKTDFEGDFSFSDDNPLQRLKGKLRTLRCPWWILRTNDAIDRAQYPVTESNDEWRNEILFLDQLIVEGFVEKWLRDKAKELGRSPKPQDRSLALLEECLIGLGCEQDRARSIVAPFRSLHYQRTILRGHLSQDKAQTLKSTAFKSHGGYKQHYAHLVRDCDESMNNLIEIFQTS